MLLQESPRKNKRYRMTFDDSTYVDFGSKNGKTFIDGRTNLEKENWYKRHEKDRNFNNPKSGIYMSKMLLWTEPTLKKSIRKLEKVLNTKIQVL